ncbi:MAG TPA: DNA methyltransferase, partial [Oculatellaceae cyanobacterium]
TRWGGRMMKHPVTGEDVPDPTDQIPIYRYINPRAAEWQEADYVVSNPPFLGKLHMLSRLNEGYIQALREVYQGKVPDGADFVMHWWYRAAQLVADKKLSRFGLITTKSISQTFNCKVVSNVLTARNPISIIFAIPNHPWVDTIDAAAVRIAMTAAEFGEKSGILRKVISEEKIGEEINIQLTIEKGQIYEDLRVGANLTYSMSLKSNSLIASTGLLLGSRGFVLTVEEAEKFQKSQPSERSIIFPLRNGEDLTEHTRKVFVIDTHAWSESELMSQAPEIYQCLREKVYPERQTNRDKRLRTYWWLFRRSNERVRSSISGLARYIATSETAKHRTFIFLEKEIRPEHKLVVIGSDDAFLLGVLSSSIHVKWALAAGGNRGVGNDPVYVKTKCFDKFPFPDPTPEQKQKIRDLGERLDAHRKQVQAQHPDVTITGMYNLLEKMRAGEPFTDKDREYNDKALVSTLKQIHDELDAAVFEAYGWLDPPQPPLERGEKNSSESSNSTRESNQSEPPFSRGAGGISDDEILERLVALNAERAEEERNGLIRWLRPDYQAPNQVAVQPVIEGITTEEEIAITPVEQQTWPKKFKEQLAAIRDLLRTSGSEWTLEQIVAQFKGATRSKKAITECLESLEELGILTSHDEQGVIHWYFAELQKAS